MTNLLKKKKKKLSGYTWALFRSYQFCLLQTSPGFKSMEEVKAEADWPNKKMRYIMDLKVQLNTLC